MQQKTIDLNCDMGEGMGNDEAIMPFISSANIACGYHAGDVAGITNTILIAQKYHVAIGAHPSFPGHENFGRKEMHLSEKELYDVVSVQIDFMMQLAHVAGTKLHHVKPHGALYNMAAKDAAMARVIAHAVKDADSSLYLYGLSGSHLIQEAKAIGLQTASEVFADRTYQPDGSLTPRSQSNALIKNSGEAVQQALAMVMNKSVQTVSGSKIRIEADTICLHGDGEHAADFARLIYNVFVEQGILIRSIHL